MSPQIHADITAHSADETDLVPGSQAEGSDGTIYIKCQAQGTINTDEWCAANTTEVALQRGHRVVPVVQGNSVQASQTLVGWNKTGDTLVSGEFFWAAKGPIVLSIKVAGLGIVTGDNLYTATTGQCVKTKQAGESLTDSVGIALSDEVSDRVDIYRQI